MSRRIDEAHWSDDSEDDDDTMPCPYCRRPIHEDAQRCPYCENYISEEDTPPRPKTWWFMVGILLCMLIVVMWIISAR
jgi:hypothetical protein